MSTDDLTRLAHRPDLADRVRSGAMTFHDALILAGHGTRKPHKGHAAAGPPPCPSEPEAAAEWIRGRFRGERLKALIEALTAGARPVANTEGN